MLEGRNVSFWYQISEPPAIYQCSFRVGDGEFLAIVGASGSGKTTLLRLACGLLRADRKACSHYGYAFEGEVEFNGEAIRGPLEKFSYVPQNFQASLIPSLTAIGNVLVAVKEDGASPQEIERAKELMCSAGIIDVTESNVRKLSGGQQQRVAICRAMVTSPHVLFMDEPFANLDTTLKPKMSELLHQLCAKYTLSLLLVTHDIQEAVKLSDKVIGVKRGFGKPEYHFWGTKDEGEKDRAFKEIKKWIA